MSAEFKIFKEFYPFYLSQHQNSICRTLHFVGILLGVGFLLLVILVLKNYWLAPVSLVWGYAFGWVGHYCFEKNRPATFKYPFFSFLGDFVMFKDLLIGKIKF
jgi:hypothetical protein